MQRRHYAVLLMTMTCIIYMMPSADASSPPIEPKTYKFYMWQNSDDCGNYGDDYAVFVMTCKETLPFAPNYCAVNSGYVNYGNTKVTGYYSTCVTNTTTTAVQLMVFLDSSCSQSVSIPPLGGTTLMWMTPSVCYYNSGV